MRSGTFADHVHEAFTEANESGPEIDRLKKIIDDIAYVAEFGHPAIDRRDDAATLEWIKQAASTHSPADRGSQ